jgi:hypothetical protein
MPRVVTIEELANGYVVRCRGEAGNGAVAFSGEKALKKAINHMRLYLLAPTEEASTSSFPFVAFEVPEVDAIEPKPNKSDSDRLIPTEVSPADPNRPTRRLDGQIARQADPKWNRPV